MPISRPLTLILLLAMLPLASLRSQEVPLGTTVCEVKAHPADFEGKLIKLRGTYSEDLAERFLTDTALCPQTYITLTWFKNQDDVKYSDWEGSAPFVAAHPGFVLENASYRNYKTARQVLLVPINLRRANQACPERRCFAFEVSAVLTGRVMLMADRSARLVMLSVADVSWKPNVYDRTVFKLPVMKMEPVAQP